MCLLLGGCSSNRTPEMGYLISRYTQISDETEPEFTILRKNSRHENLRITAVCQPSIGNNARSCDQLKRAIGCAVKGAGPQRGYTRPGTGSLHPVAIRAAVEATRLLKPLVQRVARRLGERAGRNVSER